MKKLILTAIFLLGVYINLFSSNFTILPQNINFYYNSSTDYIYPYKARIILENSDLDSNFSWYVETNSQWIKLDNLSGEGKKYYVLNLSIDKNKISDLSKGVYQGIVTFNTDIGIGILAINLYVKPEKSYYKFGINYIKGYDDYIKLPFPYHSNWSVNGNSNFFITPYLLTLSPDNSSTMAVIDNDNHSFILDINTISYNSLYNFKYTTSTATPIDFKLLIPPTYNKLYIKITLNLANISKIYYLAKSGFTETKEPYIENDDLPLVDSTLIDLGKYTIKTSGKIEINIINDENQTLVENTYSIVPITGKWQIVDHFQNYELRYIMNVSENNGKLNGWIEFNGKKYLFSDEYSYISNDGFYIISFAPQNPEFYIKIPYYLVKDNYFYGFFMKNNSLISIIEGYKE